MKKLFTLVLSIIIVSTAFAQYKAKKLEAIASSTTVQTSIVTNGDAKPATTDTLFNILPTEMATLYGFGAPWGFWSGQNEYGFSEFAEFFSNFQTGEINGMFLLAAKDYSGTAGDVITLKVWDAGVDTPGTVLYTQDLLISDIVATDGTPTFVDFITPVPITGDFYLGYEVFYIAPADTFAVYQAEDRSTTTMINTAYVFYGGGWNALDAVGLCSSWGVGALVYLEAPVVPMIWVNNTDWDAGTTDIGVPVNSGDVFAITNIGVGNLTITSATGIAGTEFSTNFNTGISLAPGDTSFFGFTYDPIDVGADNATFSIVSNGGNVDITLAGLVIAPGGMEGDFENIADFSLTMDPWTLLDVDGGTTWGVTGIDFLHSGEPMAFIAFNPASTTPAWTDASIQPHGGVRFGACFSTVTAEAPNDDWLISPQGTIAPAGQITMWVKSVTDTYGLERYNVGVSTTGTNPGDFTMFEATYAEAPVAAWTEVQYDLSAYAGQAVYVGIQCVSNDAFVFMVDDIVIDLAVDAKQVSNNVKINVYPNPTTGTLNITNAENAAVYVYNILGEVVASINNADASSTIDMSNLSEGTYIVKILTDDNVITKKINLIK